MPQDHSDLNDLEDHQDPEGFDEKDSKGTGSDSEDSKDSGSDSEDSEVEVSEEEGEDLPKSAKLEVVGLWCQKCIPPAMIEMAKAKDYLQHLKIKHYAKAHH